MGYNTSSTTRQRKFQRRRSEASFSGVPQGWIFASLGPTLSRFSVLIDINDDVKGEILLLTRYLLDHFRRDGYKRSADNFAREANIDEEQPLDGSLGEYLELWRVEGNSMNYWTFFWYKKLEALKEHSFEGKAVTNTTPNQQHLSIHQSYTGPAMHSEVGTFSDKGMIHGPKRVLFEMLRKYIFDYIAKCGIKRVGGKLIKESEFYEEQSYDSPSGSTSSNVESSHTFRDASGERKRRRCNG